MNPLKVYKASAGSGKTFTLAVQYISLLVENPHNYRHILAVTFTNKATAEMKSRIVETLYRIGNIGNGENGENGENGGNIGNYIEKISENLGERFDRKDIVERCREALKLILHDYSRFRIETIDSFFQSIIRNLAHELNLTANLRVDLNQDQVLSDAVGSIIEDLHQASGALFLSIKAFVEEKIESGKNWDVSEEIERFSKNIFNEQYLTHEGKISMQFADEKRFGQYKKDLMLIRDSTRSTLRKCGDDIMQDINADGLTVNDFKKKSQGAYAFFAKLAEGGLPNVTATIEKYASGDDDIMASAAQGFSEKYRAHLNNAIDKERRGIEQINTCDLILHHLNQMKLLATVNDKVRQLNDEANRFLLADTAHFLNAMIDDSDVPFIYEKAGTYFRHIMIDEFQDTSALQWENFKPLLKNSFSTGHTCLIVGDVKQSIYRWRNSDWSILSSLEAGEFSDQIKSEELKVNYRSKGNVITFNNEFFEQAISTQDDPRIQAAYASIEQKVKPGNEDKGYVEVDFLDKDEDWHKHLLDTVRTLLSQGIRQDDITLLLRSNNEISAICNYFAKEASDISVISDYAFRLDASRVVMTIIRAMQVLINPDSKLLLTSLLMQLGHKAEDLLQKTTEELQAMLPEDFSTLLNSSSLRTLCKDIISSLLTPNSSLLTPNSSLLTAEAPYLFFFFDQLADYTRSYGNSIKRFLKYWDDSMCKLTIPSATTSGIHAYTIHKSKGLEFHTVICPQCDWPFEMNMHEELLWCEPNAAPFNYLSLTAITYKKDVQQSIFADDYREEHMKKFVDNLNLLYVAFTRAENNLIIFTTDQPNDKDVSGIIHAATPQHEGSRYVKGELWNSGSQEHGDSEQQPATLLTPSSGFLTANPARLTFLQSSKAREYLEDKPLYDGLIIHRVLESITSIDDLDKAMRQLESDGDIADETQKEELRQFIRSAFADERAARWYDPHWRVINECTIISKDAEGHMVQNRPDRVICDDHETIVIDYKTGKKNQAHLDQVAKYARLLREMGYTNVSGYVWYLRTKDIVKV